jgi:hypothetical protein
LVLTVVLKAAASLGPALTGLVASAGASGCTSGSHQTCSMTGCAIPAQTCTGGAWGECECLADTCDDGNPCTRDSVANYTCVHTPTPGVSCNDGNACTVGDACSASGRCAGTAVVVDDGNQCTVDACNTSTGVVTHALTAGSACDDGNACTVNDACSAAGVCAGTVTASTCDAFCYDKFGNVTKKITCAAGQSCGGCR